MVTITPKKEFKQPIFAECITPDALKDKHPDEIAQLKVWEGNKQLNFGELFKTEDDANAQNAESFTITLKGDFGKVRRVGYGMSMGEIYVEGNVGMYLGQKMCGGKITVIGNAEGWAGSEMKDGTIEIHGNAGDYLASPYRGSTVGMHGGKIIVHGNVGTDAAVYMHGGIIKIYGNTGQFLGFRMRDGTIHVLQNADTRVGASMTGGKIVVSGFLQEVMPTFTLDSIKPKVKIEEGDTANGPFYMFIGDLAERGEGKLYVSKDKNPQLKHYERFL